MTSVGTAIGSVQVQVDGTAVGTATYGITRTDVCTAYPGRPGCPNVGYVYSLNASTLSPGSHTITVVATDTDATPDSGSNSVHVTVGPPPTVSIDSPTAGSVVSGTINVTGWALDTSGTGTVISNVQVLVDGVSAGTATYGIVRNDVCALYPSGPNCPNVGFTFSLNTATYAPGAHTITVTATDSDASPDSGSKSVPITLALPPTVMIDSLTAGQVVSGVVTVGGWAIDNSATVGSAIGYVQILVDGTVVGIANYGVSRPDICNQYPGRPGCPNVGFQYMLDTRTLTSGVHTLTAQATDTDQTPDTGSWTINITVSVPPSVNIDTPTSGANVSGRIVLSGWAIDSTTAVGSAISSVQVSVDGNSVGSATYGLPRTDVCTLYPSRAGCPNVGFTYTLDTTTLSRGSHTVTVTALNSDSTPASTSASVTISVSGNGSFMLEAPTNGAVITGTVNITGWALAPNGGILNEVKVYVDGTQVGLATYGFVRMDVCSAYPYSPGCPNVGYMYPLNTTTLANGAHQITVTALTEDGQPPVGSGTVTVTVAN
jgi:hypothetical protein